MTTTATRAIDLWVDDEFCAEHNVPMEVGEFFTVGTNGPDTKGKVKLPFGDYVIVQSYPDHGLAEVAKIVDEAVGQRLLHFIC